ncbi:hypothetical protein BKA67DRAFT_9088 [Truncatella angustata]|uniref:Uncharacterized protein n=1 Tax=Truncatella angustata TaxID=152316 RepID=A0A9P9A2M9_9PEZI|nr:uncharacterized protein BKA67DRAFT_9088 [Truncatella angustata]KAH6659268.1 hypothetical protein BKA67DRAFT_9088 [Truncatella angustata]
MAIWPFSRKRSRRRSPGRGRAQEEEEDAPAKSMTEPVAGGEIGLGQSQHLKSKRQRDSAGNKKLSRRARTYSFSPGRADSLRVARARQESVPPLPTGPIPATINRDYGAHGQGPSGAAAKETEIGDRVPTLHHNNSHNKRSGQPLPRKKSSKRRKEDHDREAEIRAMSRFETMPVRSATEDLTPGRLLKRESKRAKTGSIKDWRRPESDLSLPIPESTHSDMSSDSDHISYRVSPFDALAPRPTIRYASNPVFGAPSSGQLRSSSQKRKLSEKNPISEATLKAHKRVDNLADDLDASDLRELLERDKRRRERKQEKERERVERRLARRAERQRLEEAEARNNGTPPPQNMERGVLGREAPAAEHNTTSAVITSSRRRASVGTSAQDEVALAEGEGRQRTPSPLDKFHRENSFAVERAEPPPLDQHPALRVEPESERTTSRSPSPRIIGFMKSRKRRSNSPLSPEPEKVGYRPDPTRTISKSESESIDYRRPSESGSSKAWSSFFKWSRGGRNSRNSGAPSSFSNTSRDSMLANQPVSQTPNYLPIQRSNSKVPKRTMSRFREDLPELPLSPPDSRVGSPEVEVQHSEPLPIITDDVVMRYDTPTSGHRATPSSMLREEIQPSPAPHSTSMASIDSEGSWFSGKGNRQRASSGMRGSLINYPLRSASGDSEEQEEPDEDAAHDDDFMKIVTDEKGMHHKSADEALPSSDEDEQLDQQAPKWGNVIVNRTPTFTQHRETMRSREGLLLESFDDEDDKDSGTSDKESEGISAFGGETPLPARATSINFGKGHMRNFSAGSAKLLDISPRVSTDKRRSFEPVTQ